jgi:hypothetical protein
MKKLDKNTMGIFTEIHGRQQLQYKMNLLPDEILEKRRSDVKKRLEEKGKDPTERVISNNTTIKAKEVSGLMEEFDITNEIHQHKSESPQEYARRIAKLSDYQYITEKFQEFISRTDIDALNISWKEQIILADAVTTVPDKERLINFAKKFGSSGLRSFLAVDYEREFSDTIFKIADQLSKTQAQKVFDTYSEIIDATSDIQGVIKQNAKEDVDTELEKIVRDKIERTGKATLKKVANKSEDPKQALEELEGVSRSSQALLASLYGLAKKGLDFSLDEFRDIDFEKVRAENMSEKTAQEMRDIYRRNYPEERYSQELQETLVEKLNGLLKTKGSEFYTLSYQNNVKGFVGFKQGGHLTDNQPIKQAAALNIDPSFKNHAVGHLMIENALAQEAESSILVGNSRADSRLVGRYVERGFVGTKVAKEKGSELLDIVWDKKANNNYQLKPVAKEEVIRLFEENRDGKSVQVKGSGLIQKVDSLDQLDYGPLQTGMVVTRMFEHKDGWLLAYEPAPDKAYPESIK